MPLRLKGLQFQAHTALIFIESCHTKHRQAPLNLRQAPLNLRQAPLKYNRQAPLKYRQAPLKHRQADFCNFTKKFE